jgi:hypothetical protein
VPAFDVVSGGGDLLVELLGDGFAELLPPLLGLVEGGGEGVDGLGGGAAFSSSEVRVLSGSSRVVELRARVVAFAGGGAGRGVGPAAGAGVEVVRVVDEHAEPFGRIQRGHLRTDHGVPLQTGRSGGRLGVVAGLRGGVGDPALVALRAPVGVEVVDGLFEVVSGRVDRGVVAGAAEGDVGEFAAAAGGEDVGAGVGGALGAVDGEGVALVEVVGVESFAGDVHVASVAGNRVEVVGRRCR